jgi:hypothetical protein
MPSRGLIADAESFGSRRHVLSSNVVSPRPLARFDGSFRIMCFERWDQSNVMEIVRKALKVRSQGLDDFAEAIEGVCNLVLVAFSEIRTGRSGIIVHAIMHCVAVDDKPPKLIFGRR